MSSSQQQLEQPLEQFTVGRIEQPDAAEARLVEDRFQLGKGPETLVPMILPSVAITIDADRKIEAMVDQTRFQQVLINVIKNAAEAVKADGKIIIRAWREVFPEGRGTTWEIEDDGTGITDAVAQRIFDPFYTTKPTGQGVGLGLFIAHEIVTQHDGIITAEGAPGGGTRIWIHVPDQSHAHETENASAELGQESHES